MKEMKREKRNIKLQETLVELEEYKYEVQRLKEILDYRVHSNLSTDNDSIENGGILDSNVHFNEYKDTICVLKVQRDHLMEENQQLASKVREMEETISKHAHFEVQTKW